MKKILCLFLALLILCPILLLPASAAEPEEYVFHYMEPIMVLSDDFDFSESDSSSLYNYAGHLPDGKYIVRIINSNGEEYVSPEFVVTFPGWQTRTSLRSKLFSTPRLSDSVLLPVIRTAPFFVLRFNRSTVEDTVASSTSFYITYTNSDEFTTYDSFGSLREGYSVTFIRIPPPVLEKVSNIISENPSAVFSHIISLLPIVLPVLVGFIGIQKAIEFVRDKVNKA